MPTDCLVHQQPHLETLTPAQSEALCKALRQARAMLLGANERLPEKAAPRPNAPPRSHPMPDPAAPTKQQLAVLVGTHLTASSNSATPTPRHSTPRAGNSAARRARTSTPL